MDHLWIPHHEKIQQQKFIQAQVLLTGTGFVNY